MLSILGHDTNGINGNILKTDAEALTTLDISNKDISSLQGIEAFINLTTLYCSGNNLKSYVSDSIVGKTFYCQLIDDDFIVANYNEWNLNQKRKFKLNKILTN